MLLNTPESSSHLCFPSLLLSRAVSATNPFFQHSSYSESVTCCFTVILTAAPPSQGMSLAVSCCDSSSAGSTARCVTSTQRLSSSSKLVAPSLTHAIGCRRDAVSRRFQSCTQRASPPALLKTWFFLKTRSNPSLSAWSSRAAMSDMFALPADRIVTIADWRASAI